MEPEILLQVLANYGLAGVTIYLLYKLVYEKIDTLIKEMRDLNKEMSELKTLIKTLIRTK